MSVKNAIFNIKTKSGLRNVKHGAKNITAVI